MTLAPSVPFNNRTLVDSQYIVTTSIPSYQPVHADSASAASSGSTAAVDLIQAVPYPTTEVINFWVSSSMLVGTSGSLSYTYTLQDSANNVTFADIATLAPMTGAADSAGTSSATQAVYKMPPICRRYVRVYAAGPAGSSGATGVTGSYKLTLLF